MFLSLSTQKGTSIKELVLCQRLEDAACCTSANLMHGRAQGPFAPRAHLPPFVRASASGLGQSVGDKPQELTHTLPGGTRRPYSEIMLLPRKNTSCSYQPGNPAASNLSNIIFSQVLLNILTPREA